MTKRKLIHCCLLASVTFTILGCSKKNDMEMGNDFQTSISDILFVPGTHIDSLQSLIDFHNNYVDSLDPNVIVDPDLKNRIGYTYVDASLKETTINNFTFSAYRNDVTKLIHIINLNSKQNITRKNGSELAIIFLNFLNKSFPVFSYSIGIAYNQYQSNQPDMMATNMDIQKIISILKDNSLDIKSLSLKVTFKVTEDRYCSLDLQYGYNPNSKNHFTFSSNKIIYDEF